MDAGTRRRFDSGPRGTGGARPLVEEETGEALYPCVLAAEVEGLLLCFTGRHGPDAGDDLGAKTASAALIASLEAGVIPDEYHPQMERGLMLSGASRCKFSASKGDRETIRSVWVRVNPELRADHPDVAPIRRRRGRLPACRLCPQLWLNLSRPCRRFWSKVSGEISITANFATFETRLRDFLDNRLIREPKTDQDFADLDQQIKV